jgi:beta-glucanase (GH16 family)
LSILVAVAVGVGFGIFYDHHYPSNQPNTTIYIKNSSTKTRILGPAQTNNMFSVYPSWSQDFENIKSGNISTKYWNVNLGPAQNSNHEAQYYTDNPTNLRVQDGALTLEATKQDEPQGYNYASARVDTDKKVSFLYGRIDIIAKLPVGAGIWPAAWFLPANNKYEDLSPASDTTRYLNGGEIDLVEEVGFNPNVEYGIVHTLADVSNPNGVGSYNTITLPNNDTTYNKYSLLWTPSSITFEVNDQPFYSYSRPAGSDYTTWPFDQPFYMILNLAVGGSWGGEDTADFANGIDNSIFPSTMSVQSIYYYPYVGAPVANN